MTRIPPDLQDELTKRGFPKRIPINNATLKAEIEKRFNQEVIVHRPGEAGWSPTEYFALISDPESDNNMDFIGSGFHPSEDLALTWLYIEATK